MEDKRKELSQRIERSRRELSEKEGELRKLKIEQQNINAKIQKYTNDRNLLRNKIKTFKGIKETVASKTRRVAELEKKFMDGGEKEKQQAEAEYRKAVQTLFRGIQNIADTVEKSNDILIEKAVYDKLKSEIEERNFAITEQYELAKRELANIVRELALKKRARDDYRKVSSYYLVLAINLSSICSIHYPIYHFIIDLFDTLSFISFHHLYVRYIILYIIYQIFRGKRIRKRS